MNRRMKTVCDFCKTEYSLDFVPKGPVKCAVCGHAWVVPRVQTKRNSLLTFIAAACALLAAIVFAVAVITQHQIKTIQEKPLVAEIGDINMVTGDDGVVRFSVNGRVINRSEQIYGVPWIIIVSYDEEGDVVDRQKFMPPATLLDSGGVANFSHILSVPTQNVKKIAVELEK